MQKKDIIDELLEEHADLFRDLSDSIVCPSCQKVVRGDKYNLGEKYRWTEGCKECYNKENKE